MSQIQYSQFRKKIYTYALASHAQSQNSYCDYVAAKFNKNLVKNKLRNRIKQEKISLNFFSNNSSLNIELKNAFNKFKLNIKNETNITKLNTHAAIFFKNLLAQVSEQNKLKAKKCLEIIAESSSNLINCIDIDGEKIKEFLKNYFTAMETFVSLLEIDDNELKNIILCSTALAGFLLTYEQRSIENKALVAVKQNLFAVAYISGAVLGLIITLGLSPIMTPPISAAVGSIVSTLVTLAVGSVTGFILTKALDKSADKCLEKAQENVISIIDKNIEKSLKKIDSGLSYTKKNYTIKYTRKIFKKLMPTSTTPKKDLVAIMHQLLNEAKNKPTSIRAHLEKQIKGSEADITAAAILALNREGINLKIIKNLSVVIFLIFDNLIDIMGMLSTLLIDKLIETLPHIAGMLVDFGISSVAGLIPTSIGILIYFSLSAIKVGLEKKTYQLPNDNSIYSVQEAKKQKLEKIKFTLSKKDSVKLIEKENKFTAFMYTSENEYEFNYYDSLLDIPEGYLHYPIIEYNINILEEKKLELESELEAIEKRILEIKKSESAFKFSSLFYTSKPSNTTSIKPLY